MRKTLQFLVLFTCLLFAPTLHGQGAEKVLVKSFNLEGNNAIQLNLPGQVETREWDNNYLRIELRVSVAHITESLLRTLIESGRYNIYGKTEDGFYKVFIPGLSKQVKVGGKEIEESFIFTVLHPASSAIMEETAPAAEPEVEPSSTALIGSGL